MKVWTLIAFFAGLLNMSYSSRILVLMPYSGKSHYIFQLPLIQELANRGHDLTVVATYKENNANYKQITVDYKSIWDALDKIPDLFALEELHYVGMMDLVWRGTYSIAETVFNSTSLQDFIKNDNSHFDLIITEIFYHESLYMFAHKYQAPMVGIITMTHSQLAGYIMGSPLILPYMTHEFLYMDSKLSFFDRIFNIFATLYEISVRQFYLLPLHQGLAEKNFPNLPKPLPSLRDLEDKFAVIFCNGHFSYDKVKPYVPGIVEIGGMHVKPSKPLPDSIQKFLDEAKDGAIYFSLGSNIKSKDMPKEKVQIFLNVFKKLKQRVLWKWETDTLEGTPNNLMLGKWLPQNDILAHPNVKLFITHGGLLSTQEALHHGVPVIGIPFFADQHLNTHKIENIGLGLKIRYISMTEDTLRTAIEKIIYDPQYQKTAKELSFRFKDRPNTPMETAIFWIEYVIRHKGASFMKSPILDIPFYIYYMLDVLGFIILCLSCVLFVVYKLVSLFRKICMPKKQSMPTNHVNMNNNKKLN